jgi:16S rRNA (guanine966-N2)-methyltransferase
MPCAVYNTAKDKSIVMRIIAGKYKNKKIESPEGIKTRPILVRVRKSLFDILQPYLDNARMLDLFSGSGIMALEAFSRGAAFVMSVDSDAHATKIAETNYKNVCPDKPFRLIRGDVIQMLPRLPFQEEPFDIIGVTPPYGNDLANQTLAIIDQNPIWLKPETVIFVQSGYKEDIKVEWQNLEHVRTRKYGKTVMDFFMPFEKEESEQEEPEKSTEVDSVETPTPDA